MIVLDTNVVSELLRPVPTLHVAQWYVGRAAPEAFVSAVTEAELRYGVAIMPVGRRRDSLAATIDGLLEREFFGRILPFNSPAARAYATIAAERRAAGRPIQPADCQIAAIARPLGASVATRDTGGFEGCGVELINPWTD